MCFDFDSSSWVLCGWLQLNLRNDSSLRGHWRLASSWLLSWHQPPFSPSELTAWACVLWTSQHLGCPSSTCQSFLRCAYRKQNAHDLHLVRFPSTNDKKISIPTFGIYSSWNLFRLHLTESGAAQPWKAGRATFIYETKMHGNFQFLRIPKAFLQRSFYLHCGHLLTWVKRQHNWVKKILVLLAVSTYWCVWNVSINLIMSQSLISKVIWMSLPPWG